MLTDESYLRNESLEDVSHLQAVMFERLQHATSDEGNPFSTSLHRFHRVTSSDYKQSAFRQAVFSLVMPFYGLAIRSPHEATPTLLDFCVSRSEALLYSQANARAACLESIPQVLLIAGPT